MSFDTETVIKVDVARAKADELMAELVRNPHVVEVLLKGDRGPVLTESFFF